MKKIVSGLLIATASLQGIAQDNEPIVRPFQISLVTPLGTNGLQSPKVINNVSFNAIAGVSAGVKGFEAAGVSNITRGSVKGIQLAGISNVATDSLEGFQAAGITNITQKSNGAQFGGIANISYQSYRGIQGAGFTNISGTGEGAQVAGFNNILHKGGTGAQIAGFGNTARDTYKGVQVSGFYNTASTVEGAQIAGFVNVAKKVKGVQIGFINISDTLDGVAIGFLSFCKKGYRAIEVSGNETFHTNLSLKTGTHLFYNILTAGARWTPDKPIWTVGYGAGSRFLLGGTSAIDVEVIANSAIPEDINEDNWQLINKLHVSYNRKLFDTFWVHAGPTFNVVVQDKNNTQDVVPWDLYTIEKPNTTVILYPGFNLGIKF